MASDRKKTPKLTIGQRIWHRYAEYVVAGETSRSWLIRYVPDRTWVPSAKLPKAFLSDDEWFFTEQEKLDWLYVQVHRYWIGEKITKKWRSSITADQLRQIAEIIGCGPQVDMPERLRPKVVKKD